MSDCREVIRSNLERYISESKYSQKEIAEKLGVSKSSVTNWIKGKNSPDINLVPSLCDLLEIPFSALFPSSRYSVESLDMNISPSLEDGDEELLAQYHRLDSYDRGRVAGYIDRMLESEKYQKDGQLKNA